MGQPRYILDALNLRAWILSGNSKPYVLQAAETIRTALAMGADRGEIMIEVKLSSLPAFFISIVSGIHIDVPADQMTTFQVNKETLNVPHTLQHRPYWG